MRRVSCLVRHLRALAPFPSTLPSPAVAVSAASASSSFYTAATSTTTTTTTTSRRLALPSWRSSSSASHESAHATSSPASSPKAPSYIVSKPPAAPSSPLLNVRVEEIQLKSSSGHVLPQLILGEGPLWSAKEQKLYFIDIVGKLVLRYDPATRLTRTWSLGVEPGCIVPRSKGGFMCATADGYSTFDERTGTLTPIPGGNPEAHLPNRWNDGWVDPVGRFYAGTMHREETKGAGALYVLDTDLQVRRVHSPVTVSNGLAWSKDHKTCYYIDSTARVVAAFDWDAKTGNLREHRVAFHIPHDQGWPDGLCIDADDNLYVAHWDGWRVTKWTVNGSGDARCVGTLMLPCPRVTACCFGGPDMNDLYISSAAIEIDPKAVPLAGSLFVARSVVAPGRGLTCPDFIG